MQKVYNYIHNYTVFSPIKESWVSSFFLKFYGWRGFFGNKSHLKQSISGYGRFTSQTIKRNCDLLNSTWMDEIASKTSHYNCYDSLRVASRNVQSE